MKYSDINFKPKRIEIIPAELMRGLRPPEAEAVVGSPEIFREMTQFGWVKPIVQGKGLTLYDRDAVLAAYDRLKTEGRPSQTSMSESEGTNLP